MALPSSGQISISQIRDELIGNGSSYSLRQLSAWAGKSTPDAMSEFYGYSAVMNLYIDWTVPSSTTCYSYYTFGAYVTSYTNVNTDVNVTIDWYGDLGGYMSGTVTIYSGTSCGVNYNVYSGGNINCWGENFSYANVYISPSASGNHNYYVGNQASFYAC